uniref:DUF1302 domain-containing protein n=1 Tax=Candidatus Kentrum sp. SD TaxID=2126332 RepID=A0A450YC04_9GAMM|nr:MAG: Protein of unknown function (DUF1302) [Candidatus Kentron sp. SD]VFK49634.1 MAG: Protein of unknown function (DUF1302) [Candidatus Kentron sp. SD]
MSKKYHAWGRPFVCGGALSFFMMAPVCGQAIEFGGDVVSGNIDSTVSLGTISRVQDRDSATVCQANGGTAYSCNFDDGNLNYDTGIVSQVAKIVSDIELDHKSGNMGAFFRVRAYMDTRNNDNTDTKRTDLSDRGVKLIGKDLDVLDAYGWLRFDVADRPAEFRFGKHVLNWGESTFIPGGISAINPVDMAALRTPGSEIREALLPVNMLSASMHATDDLSVEGFYQLEWDKVVMEPAGSYFSANDVVSDGGDTLYLGWGNPLIRDDIGTLGLTPGQHYISRAADRKAGDGGQWGVALRHLAEGLNDTEFGVYYMNYHSRTGVMSGTLVGGVVPNYFFEYPEDIRQLGLSFNTSVGKWALQGEYSYKNDAPLQIDDIEIVLATLGQPSQVTPSGPYIQGYIKRDASQMQATMSRVFGNVMGANEFTFAGEAAITHLHDMPDKNVLRLEGSGTTASGNPLHRYHPVLNPNGSPIVESADHFPDATSWGYRLSGQWTYNDVFKGVNLLPHAAFQHDVQGVSPTFNFLEGRKATTVGVTATYQEEWAANISYTSFFGAGRYNLLNDRDYVQASVKYSF